MSELEEDACAFNENPSGKKQKLGESDEGVQSKGSKVVKQKSGQGIDSSPNDSNNRPIESGGSLQTEITNEEASTLERSPEQIEGPSTMSEIGKFNMEKNPASESESFLQTNPTDETESFPKQTLEEKPLKEQTLDEQTLKEQTLKKQTLEEQTLDEQTLAEQKENPKYIFGSAFKTISFGSIAKPSIFSDTPSSQPITLSILPSNKSSQTFTEVSYETGEEEETTLCSAKVKVYLFDGDNKEWKERGIGLAKINQSAKDPSKSRIVIRHDVTKKVLINHRLSENALVGQGKAPRTFQLSVPDDGGKLQIYLLKCSNDESFDDIWTNLQQIVNK